MVTDELDYVVGVDTHRDEHTLAVVETTSGALVAERTVASNARGYHQALRFAQQHAAAGRVWALEGVGHYGAGLARYLSRLGETVLEVVWGFKTRVPPANRNFSRREQSFDTPQDMLLTPSPSTPLPGSGMSFPTAWRPSSQPDWSEAWFFLPIGDL